ncbi:MAG: hypothetical protein ACU0BK_12120 [Shimia sp.]|nr:hypothetical protein [Shimia sp. SK013]
MKQPNVTSIRTNVTILLCFTGAQEYINALRALLEPDPGSDIL